MMMMMSYDTFGKFGEQPRSLGCFRLLINQFLHFFRALKHFLHASRNDDWFKSIVKRFESLGA